MVLVVHGSRRSDTQGQNLQPQTRAKLEPKPKSANPEKEPPSLRFLYKSCRTSPKPYATVKVPMLGHMSQVQDIWLRIRDTFLTAQENIIQEFKGEAGFSSRLRGCDSYAIACLPPGVWTWT